MARKKPGLRDGGVTGRETGNTESWSGPPVDAAGRPGKVSQRKTTATKWGKSA
ncbi:MAG: hypothetical protein ACHQ6U_04675 [Thermodesulfobacteriota bacterium]